MINSVGAIISNKKGNILIQKNIKLGKWTLPSGKAEAGEDIAKAMIREVREEWGLKVTGYKLLASEKTSYPGLGEVTNNLFEVTSYYGTPTNNEPSKCSSQGFADVFTIRLLNTKSDYIKMMLKFIK